MDEWAWSYPQNANIKCRDGSVDIHPTATVSPDAVLESGVKIGAYTTIGPGVELSQAVHVASYVMIGGRTTVGEGSRIFPFVTLGSTPQDLKYRGEKTGLVVGPRNTIREYVNIAVGTHEGGGTTRIGADNVIMVHAHIGHDCLIGNHCVLANGVNLGGHVELEDAVVISGGVAVHQFVRVGRQSMIAAHSAILQDVPPFALALGVPGRFRSVNTKGLQRDGFSQSEILELKRAFRLLFDPSRRLSSRLSTLEELDSEHIQHLVRFVRDSKRGICGAHKG